MSSGNSPTNAERSSQEGITEALILSHCILDTQLTVETDVSNYVITTILSITHSDGEIHSIAFHSHILSSSELNYDIHDKELLAIFEAF